MGIANSPDIFQREINQIMDVLDYVQAYLDDILIVTKITYEDNLNQLDTIFQKLHVAYVNVNIEKARLLLSGLNIWVTIIQCPVCVTKTVK
jgi:dTDP-D-glucose 4,6-dehydratase